uniref:B30.2/SPRY domain-containing protein n=1 Tax=Ornithorhynchus anatinus TaxID=9258 RepID=F6UAL4_ORNAN
MGGGDLGRLLGIPPTSGLSLQDKVAAQRRVIEAQFEATRRLLAEEERAQLRKLEEEEEKGLQNLQKNRAELARNVAGLERTIAHLDRETQKPPLELLRESRDTISRCEEALRPPEVVSVDLERECHVPGLQEMLSKFAVDMTLDRDSAHGDLEVSRDGRSVKNGWNDPSDEARPPDPSAGVLGSASFSAGRHYWEVDVAAKTAWELGLCLESAPREGLTAPGPQDGFWILKLDRESGYFACTSPRTHLPLGAVVDRLAVYLDVEAGVVAFYDAERGTLIYTFSASFSGPLRPFFCPQLPYGGENGVPLTLCPATPLDSEDPSLPDILVVEA